jgi:hypothetical protein
MEDEPSIAVGPLKVWVHGRQFPESDDYWDGNWLFLTARCDGHGSRVSVTDSCLHLSEVKKWKDDLDAFRVSPKGVVELATMEPTLKVKIGEAKSSLGQMDMHVSLSADHLNEEHTFRSIIDQSYLPGLSAQLAAILRSYPIKG